jgi:hypothetical protein
VVGRLPQRGHFDLGRHHRVVGGDVELGCAGSVMEFDLHPFEQRCTVEALRFVVDPDDPTHLERLSNRGTIGQQRSQEG